MLLCLLFPFGLNAQPQAASTTIDHKQEDAETLFRSAVASGSFRQWKKAARAGHREAQLAVGRAYLDKKKFRSAQPYLRAAAEAGDPEAQGWMGLIYRAEGWGDVRPKDLPNPDPYVACVWLWLSKMSGNESVDDELKQIADWDLGKERFREAKAEARLFSERIKAGPAQGFTETLSALSPPSAFMLEGLKSRYESGWCWLAKYYRFDAER